MVDVAEGGVQDLADLFGLERLDEVFAEELAHHAHRLDRGQAEVEILVR